MNELSNKYKMTFLINIKLFQDHKKKMILTQQFISFFFLKNKKL